MPQRPAVAQPAFQPAVLYVAPEAGKVTVEEGAEVSILASTEAVTVAERLPTLSAIE